MHLQSHFRHKETDQDPDAGDSWTLSWSFFNDLLLPPTLSPHHFLHSYLLFAFSPPGLFPSILSFNPVSKSLCIFHSLFQFYPLSKLQPANKDLALLDLTKSRG